MRFQLIALALAVGLISPLRGSAEHATGPATDTTVNGLALSLSIPKSVYPWNALVRVRLTIRNLTSQPMILPQSCADNPRVEAMNDRGTVVYPPQPRDRPCVNDAPLALDPGASLERSLYVVLRGRYVRAAVTMASGSTNQTAAGDSIPLTLVRQTAPVITMRKSPVIAAFIRPRSPVHGPLFHRDVYECGVDSDMTYWARTTKWTRMLGTRIVPHWPLHCGYPSEWHVTAGWLNEPVVKADYIDGISLNSTFAH
jgi:hypothetical protein